MKTLIKNVLVVNDNSSFKASVLIEDETIKHIQRDVNANIEEQADTVIDGTNKVLIPGVIDDQVHFREPGLTDKGNIYSESRAAAAGGITSFMDMPNTNPPTTSLDLLEQKHIIAKNDSLVNYSFYMGATNDNLNEIKKINPKNIPGVKLFLGSSTGNMLIDKDKVISDIFSNSPVLCAVHCESDDIINQNLAKFKQTYGENIPFKSHYLIRSHKACYESTKKAISLAKKTNCRLHILHLSTAKELELLESGDLSQKQITAEVCVHHLWFNDNDYEKLGAKIKWNPAIKNEEDRLALISGLKNGLIDIVATDHAPHLLGEKNNPYTKSPSGAPMVQHSLLVMLEMVKKSHFTIEEVVKFMCHKPAELFKIHKRGFIKEGYYADLVLLNLNGKTNINSENILYKCKWSPLEGETFNSSVLKTFVNGKLVYDEGKIIENNSAKALVYNS